MGVVNMWVGVANSAIGCGRSISIDSTSSFLNESLFVTEDNKGAGPDDAEMRAAFLLLELGC